MAGVCLKRERLPSCFSLSKMPRPTLVCARCLWTGHFRSRLATTHPLSEQPNSNDNNEVLATILTLLVAHSVFGRDTFEF